MTRMKDERNKLRIIMSQYMGDDLVLLSLQDVTNLEQQLEFSLYKVRLRKVTTKCEQFDHYVPHRVGLVLASANTRVFCQQQELLDQQLLEMRHRVCTQNSVSIHLLQHIHFRTTDS
jgi:hypothetical protein